MTVSDSDINELCKSMKETALANTWQDSEKAKIKEVTKNTLISWGVLKESEGGIYPTNAYALLTGRMSQQLLSSVVCLKEQTVRILLTGENLRVPFRNRWKLHIGMSLKKSIWE